MRIDFIEGLGNDGDEQVQHNDGHEDCVDDEEEEAVLASNVFAVVIVKLTHSDKICVEDTAEEAFRVWHKFVLVSVSVAHHFERIAESNDSYTQNEQKVAHIDNDCQNSSNQESSRIKNSEEIQEPKPKAQSCNTQHH